MPDALVVTDVVERPLKVALAPLPGAAKVTLTLESGVLFESRTITESGVAKGVFTVVDCGVPPLTVTEAGGSTAGLLVSEKAATLAMLSTLAMTE
jgi:hypothetical protein